MTDRFRVAIAGIGAVARIHARSIVDIEHAQVVAGSCRTESKGREFADTFDCEWYADTEAMLEAVDPDVLDVCTPSGTHLDVVASAAERGIDVLCEKPLEITTERIDRMASAADAGGIELGAIFHQRYNPVIRTLHDAAAGGRFGDLSTVNAYVPWWREDEYYAPDRWQGTEQFDGGGALMNQSIHGVDAIGWLAGATMNLPPEENPVEEVFAYTANRAHGDRIEVEDCAVAVLRYRNGALGQVLGSTSMYPGSLKRVQIGGRGGTAEILEDELSVWRFHDDREEDAEIRAEFGESTEIGGGAADPMAIDYANHRRNIAAFLDSLSAGEPFALDVREARKAVEIIEAIYESAERNEPVGLD